MPDELFRFSVVRNPRAVPDDRLRERAVDIVPRGAREDYRYTTILRTLRQRPAPRSEIIANAQQLQASPDFLANLSSLKTPLWAFCEQLTRRPPGTLAALRALIDVVFGRSAGATAADPDFQHDCVVVADSLVVASVATPNVPGLRSRLMQGRRAIAAIVRLAEDGEQAKTGSLRLLSATLLLPSSIFPLPDANQDLRDKNAMAHAQRKAALEKQQARAQELLATMGRNTKATEELSNALSGHLFDVTHQPRPGAPTGSLSLLPAERVARLSPAAKNVLAELEIPTSAVDVPFVVGRLETLTGKLGLDLRTHFGDVLVDAVFAEPTCGECHPIILPDPRPPNTFSPNTRGEVQVVGIQDLLVVRQTLHDYQPGEIAHVENVLKGESKSKIHRTLDRSEQTTVEEVEREQQIESELQTTDKNELHIEASKAIQDAANAEAGVTVTATYGPVSVEAHGSYATSESTAETRSSASTFARDVVSRSLQRLRERVTTRQTRTRIAEVEITNQHQLDNARGTEHITGVYRWLEKRYEAQIVNYGQRTMLEFMIPEPAAFYTYASSNKPALAPMPNRPEQPGFCRDGVFRPLTPADIQPESYLCFVGKYNVKNVTAPVPRYRIVADLLKYKIDSAQAPVAFAETNDSFKLPEGYVPRSVRYVISGGNSHSQTTDKMDIIFAVVAIGDQKVFRYYKSELVLLGSWPAKGQVIEWGNPLTAGELADGSYSIGDVRGDLPLPASTEGTGDPDVVKVSLTGHTTLPMSVTIHYSVTCERTRTKFEQWQIETFNAIMNAYENLKADYDDAVRQQQESEADELQGRNPQLNRDIEKHELKKFSISLLTGQQYDSFNAMEQDYATGIPQVAPADAAAEGRFVRFFEQALEWRNMTYLFYPYFWGNKKRWSQSLLTTDPDPLFQHFLQAGYARVWVPVRPGFDQVLVNYIECGGEPWTEKDAPILGGPGVGAAPTVALIDEITEQLGKEFTARPGSLRVRKGSTLATGTGTDIRADDVDREILIGLASYRIDHVDEAAQQLRLRAAYAGDDADEIGFGIGVKFVGEPWLVQVPTTLVHLTATDPIPD